MELLTEKNKKNNGATKLNEKCVVSEVEVWNRYKSILLVLLFLENVSECRGNLQWRKADAEIALKG